MDSRTVLTLVKNELLQLLRSKRTIAFSVVLPLFLWPLILFLSNLSLERQAERAQQRVYRFALLGDGSAEARRWIAAAVDLDNSDTTEAEGGDPETPGQGPLIRFVDDSEELATKENLSFDSLEAALDSEAIDFFVEAQRASEDLPIEAEGASDGDNRALPKLTFHYRSDRDRSQSGWTSLRDLLLELRQSLRREELREAGFPIDPADLLPVSETELASAEHASGALLGRFLTAFLVGLLLTGGSVVAMDSLAGEKERGTLETLLTTGAGRGEIVVAKQLAILLVALAIVAVNVVNMLVWIGLELIPVPERFSTPLSFTTGALLFVLYLPLVALTSSVLLLLSAYAKSYKEAQLLFFPVFVLFLAPTFIAIFPGVELRSALVLLPIANLAVGVKELLAGTPDALMLSVAWLLNSLLAGGLLIVSLRTLSSERLITASDLDRADLLGGAAIFPRHVLRWFAVLWAVFLIWQLQLEAKADVRLVIAINMALFLVTSALLIRGYRLDPKEALGLHRVKAPVWMAVLLGVPGGLALSSLVGTLSQAFFEIPDSWIETFTEGLLPENVPFWQLLLLLSIAPGICEEIAFRGVLLHGLSRRFHPLLAALIVALVFGVFHVSLFRILPTATLGLLLALLTLATGSILPAMLWHALHNGLAAAIDHWGWLEKEGSWPLAVALPLLAVALTLIWFFRSPNPALRWSRRRPRAEPTSQAGSLTTTSC